ncbi:YbaB/EbfC family nucleoid-associated protein [Jatrophihabitans sp. YIM 134969]
MRPASDAEPTGPEDTVLGALTSLTANGSDTSGNVEVTLDGRGRLVDLVVSDLVVAEGRRAVERQVREAFDAAADELDRLRQAEGQRMLESGQMRIAALTGQLQQLSDHADARMRDALEQLRTQADRIGGSA